jgi:hypothetical protein
MSKKAERWLPIVGYEGWYEVSDRGRVHRVKPGPHTRPGYILNHAFLARGYPTVHLCKNGGQFKEKIHRLVAKAFVGLPKKGQIINHKNGIKTDNRPENLEWCTYSENHLHKHRVLGIDVGETHGMSKLKNADIPLIRQLIAENKLTQKAIGDKFNVSARVIRSIKTGRCWATIK